MTEQNLIGRVAEAQWRRKHPQWATPKDGQTVPHLNLPARAVPRYFIDRAAIQIRNRVRGRQPWITEEARKLLDGLLKPTDQGLEFGPGDTTLFFAARVGHVDAVEGFDQWYDALATRLSEQRIDNVTLHLASADQLGYESEAHRDAYVNAFPDHPKGSLDFVFVDGEYRDGCALRGLELLDSGGLLILDNADTYLPAQSRSPWRVARPATRRWEEFAERTRDWRRVWTTNGVWDTAIWFKP